MDPIVSAACELLAAEHGFVLATIIEHWGSAPRTSGTRMLISAEQKIVGTIGGGLLEAETMRAAMKITPRTPARILTFDLSNQAAAAMEMICGGRVRVLLDYISPDDEHRGLFDSWRDMLAQGRKTMLVTVVHGVETRITRVDHSLIGSLDAMPAGRQPPEPLRRQIADAMAAGTHIRVLRQDDCLVVVDPGHIAHTLYIFGAGHVARPTAHVAAMVGFDVVVLDDRNDFASADRFPEAKAVQTLAGFDTAFDTLPVDQTVYVLIITRGHLHDRTVLAQALKTPACYIGMIGSRRKRDAIYEQLLMNGFTAADIARVHSPVGLNIGADTPEEIAVSIVAELIAVRAKVHEGKSGNRETIS